MGVCADEVEIGGQCSDGGWSGSDGDRGGMGSDLRTYRELHLGITHNTARAKHN